MANNINMFDNDFFGRAIDRTCVKTTAVHFPELPIKMRQYLYLG